MAAKSGIPAAPKISLEWAVPTNCPFFNWNNHPIVGSPLSLPFKFCMSIDPQELVALSASKQMWHKGRFRDKHLPVDR